MHKKNRFFVLVALGTLSLFVHCNDNTNEEAPPLNGKIGGSDWAYKFAKANFNAIDEVYDCELYGSNQTESDPCSIFISGENHLQVRIPNRVGNYQIPADINVFFENEGTDRDFNLATSGFIDISAASGGQIVGFMQATFDDDNTVEGTFSFNRCNN